MNKGWPTVKIRQVVRQEREQVGACDGNGLPVLGVTNVHGVTQTGVEASEDKSKYQRLRPGRFVYNPYRINVGSIGLSRESQDGICSPAYVVFAPAEQIDARFLYFFLKSARGNQLINFHGNRGTVRSALRFEDLGEIEIPLPPFAEQQRIVDRMEELAAQIHRAQALREIAANEAVALNATAMYKHLWVAEKTETLADLVAEGKSISYGVLVPGPEVDDGVPFVRVQDLSVRNASVRPAKRISLEIEKSYARTRLQGGEILLAVVGATIGKIGVAPQSWRGANIARAVCRIAPGPKIESAFLAYMLQSQYVQQYFQKATRTLAQPTLNVSDIKQTRIPVPPISMQYRIISVLDSLQAEIDELKRLQTETAAELAALLPAMLDRAFKGEL